VSLFTLILFLVDGIVGSPGLHVPKLSKMEQDMCSNGQITQKIQSNFVFNSGSAVYSCGPGEIALSAYIINHFNYDPITMTSLICGPNYPNIECRATGIPSPPLTVNLNILCMPLNGSFASSCTNCSDCSLPIQVLNFHQAFTRCAPTLFNCPSGKSVTGYSSYLSTIGGTLIETYIPCRQISAATVQCLSCATGSGLLMNVDLSCQ